MKLAKTQDALPMTEERDLATPAEPGFRMRIRVKETPPPAPLPPPAPPAPVSVEPSRNGLSDQRAKELRQLARALAAVLTPQEAAQLGRALLGGKAEPEAAPKRGRGRPRKSVAAPP